MTDCERCWGVQVIYLGPQLTPTLCACVPCRHWWKISRPQPGAVETGRCKRCGATRTFEHAPAFVTTVWGERRVSGRLTTRGRKVG